MSERGAEMATSLICIYLFFSGCCFDRWIANYQFIRFITRRLFGSATVGVKSHLSLHVCVAGSRGSTWRTMALLDPQETAPLWKSLNGFVPNRRCNQTFWHSLSLGKSSPFTFSSALAFEMESCSVCGKIEINLLIQGKSSCSVLMSFNRL